MKKLIFILGSLVFATSLFITGCTDDEEEPPQGDPSIEFVSEAGYISSNTTLPVSTSYIVKVRAEQHAGTEAKLTSLKISSTFTQTGKADWDTTIVINNQASITYDISFVSAPVEGTEIIEFLVIDENSRSSEITLTITTEGNVQKYENVDMGSYNDPLGSFFVTATGEVLTINEATGRQEDVDFLFFLGATNGSTIACPADEVAIVVFAIENWSIKNETRFIHPAPISAAEFDAIGNTYEFPEFTVSLSTTRAVQLDANDVIFFQTVGGERGFIKINSVNNRGDVVNVDVIVEK